MNRYNEVALVGKTRLVLYFLFSFVVFCFIQSNRINFAMKYFEYVCNIACDHFILYFQHQCKIKYSIRFDSISFYSEICHFIYIFCVACYYWMLHIQIQIQIHFTHFEFHPTMGMFNDTFELIRKIILRRITHSKWSQATFLFVESTVY